MHHIYGRKKTTSVSSIKTELLNLIVGTHIHIHITSHTHTHTHTHTKCMCASVMAKGTA
jgi:hypothetical protein